ncbi:RING-CH-type domain-containing protein [Heracleum sosnowskyi]|uniref:RING-CH-type domain-containing protein n=1 Tax=Heracleum sosnowskyi TaxID=360622 RepID=A0AAD8MRJ3_9APIA|nr:RING-CH-type domain-containing protein [Heracleum sosnowskyi]
MDQELSEKKGVVSEKVDLGLGNGLVSSEMVENSGVSENRVVVEMTREMRVVEEEKVCENRDVINHDVVSKGLDDDKGLSCVIDVKTEENLDAEWVCRICHLSSDQSLESASTSASASNEKELIQLGCGCKDELGSAHSYCAEAWFKLKGNRLCEICGQTAKNITGIADNRFMEQWNDRIFSGYGIRSSERSGGCWRGQPFCNFLMACLVIAFVLPWFFRVNMF